MKTFVIERDIPGAAALSDEELNGIAEASCAAISDLGRPYRWLHTYVAGDKFYCVHAAESEADVREHARLGGFPVKSVSELASVIDSSGVRAVPA